MTTRLAVIPKPETSQTVSARSTGVPASSDWAKDSKPTNSLERAFDLLEMVGDAPGGLTNAQISKRLGIATSTCSYILSRLESKGYVARSSETGRYEIGLKVLTISRGVLRRMKFRKVAGPVLEKVSSEMELDAIIGVLDRDRLIVISRVSGVEFSNADVDTGTELATHTTALGKVLLAHRPEEITLDLIKNRGLTKLAPKTIVSTAEFLAELDLARKRGYAIADEEHLAGLRSIAAPIIDSEGFVRAAIAVVGSTKQEVWQHMPSVIEQVRSAAREISRLMRFP